MRTSFLICWLVIYHQQEGESEDEDEEEEEEAMIATSTTLNSVERAICPERGLVNLCDSYCLLNLMSWGC